MKNSFENRDLYCVWFGGEMSDNRKRCYDSMLLNVNVNVILITENNIDEYIVRDRPLPIGFQYLSAVHKADYMRAYLLNYYGGVYSDIKYTTFDFNPYFDMLEQSDKYCIGYREQKEEWVGYLPAKQNWREYIGTGMSIHRPNTPLTNKWIDLVHKTILKRSDILKKYPGTYHPRAVTGGILDNPYDFKGSRYPFKWGDLGPDLWHKAQHENLGNWLFDLPPIDMENYR